MTKGKDKYQYCLVDKYQFEMDNKDRKIATLESRNEEITKEKEEERKQKEVERIQKEEAIKMMFKFGIPLETIANNLKISIEEINKII